MTHMSQLVTAQLTSRNMPLEPLPMVLKSPCVFIGLYKEQKIYINVHMYIKLCIHIYMYIHTHIYIYTHKHMNAGGKFCSSSQLSRQKGST